MHLSGDSYSSTGFDVSGIQPGPNNPFGNPQNLGEGTTCDGRNWVNWLAASNNESLVKTYNIAWEASTVDWNRIHSLSRPYSNDFIGQLENKFVEHYSDSGWNASTTLFSIFFGINDVHQTYRSKNASAANAGIFDGYKGLVDELYRMGARIFLFLNVPPIDRSPGTNNKREARLKDKTIADWNKRVSQMATNMSTVYTDTAVFVFDSHKLFEEILNDPTTHPETAEIANTSNYCEVYRKKLFHPDPPSPKPHYFDRSCGASVDRYFWIDGSHPTWPVHKAMAAEIGRLLKAGPLVS